MRYKAGWYIPQKVLALTHLVPDVTQEDFVGIANATNACLRDVNQPFHLIIDNRILKSEQVVSLDVILSSTPQVQKLPLRWIMMILPYHIRDRADTLAPQEIDDVHLQFAKSLGEAERALWSIDASINWKDRITDFFVPDGIFRMNDH